MKFNDLDWWVDYIQGLHLRSIDLSLDRVGKVYSLLYPQGIDSKIISLAGTNGKGSSAELLTSIFAEAGYTVGKYTSPHLCDFNERYQINRKQVDDKSLIEAFQRVENARNDVALTFFEYGTLIAIDLFAKAKLDVVIMEVGLGGRLDAVNILDADIALITNISIDHVSWLGNTVEKIALEKAGIARANRDVVVASESPPINLLEHLTTLGAHVYTRDVDFFISNDEQSKTWNWSSEHLEIGHLPLPFSQSGVQLDNAAGVLMVVELMKSIMPVDAKAILDGLSKARLRGRCQLIENQPSIILDVSHNEASLERLAEFIRENKNAAADSKCIAVCGMLKDKKIAESLKHIVGLVDSWCLATIHHERGSSAEELQNVLPKNAQVNCFDHVQNAYDGAYAIANKCDCLVVFGSFHIVGDIIKHRREIAALV